MTTRLVAIIVAAAAAVAAGPVFGHDMKEIGARQAAPVAAPAGTTSAGPAVLTVITPSPGATPVQVTSQRQLVTSFLPQWTACVLPPVAEIPQPTPAYWPTTKPYSNFTASYDTGFGSCTTVYEPTITPVCRSTLSGIVDRYTITACDQNVTFSTQYGYALVTATPTLSNATGTANATLPATITPRPSLSVRTLTTYFIASWQALTTAGPPEDVDLRICTTFSNGTQRCVLEYQIWVPTTVTYVSTAMTSINLTTTIANGPSQIIFETITANVTERFTTFSMIDTVELAYSIESESTSSMNRTMTATSTLPTVYETYTVQPASTASSSSIRRTTTVQLTSTVYAGTVTLHASSTSAPPGPGAEGGPDPAVVRATATPTFDVTSILAQGKRAA